MVSHFKKGRSSSEGTSIHQVLRDPTPTNREFKREFRTLIKAIRSIKHRYSTIIILHIPNMLRQDFENDTRTIHARWEKDDFSRVQKHCQQSKAGFESPSRKDHRWLDICEFGQEGLHWQVGKVGFEVLGRFSDIHGCESREGMDNLRRTRVWDSVLTKKGNW